MAYFAENTQKNRDDLYLHIADRGFLYLYHALDLDDLNVFATRVGGLYLSSQVVSELFSLAQLPRGLVVAVAFFDLSQEHFDDHDL